MLDLVGKRYWYFLLSAAIIVPGLISLLLFGLRPGIDFSSGTTMTLRFEKPVEQAALRSAFAALGHSEAVIQRSGDRSFLVRTVTLAPEKRDAEGKVVEAAERERLLEGLKGRVGKAEVLSYDSVSPIIAGETVRNAALAVVAAAVGIMLYITWAFRKVPRPLRYGVCAIVALLHDTLVVVGVFSILGRLFGIEVDALFITGLLTVIGFSVHDTIVVFDRIRENLRKGVARTFDEVVNQSLLQTLGRSISTSLTVVLTLLALYLFGGVTIHTFVLTLLIGIVSGTYSSIFNASQLLVVWEHGELRLLLRRLLPARV